MYLQYKPDGTTINKLPQRVAAKLQTMVGPSVPQAQAKPPDGTVDAVMGTAASIAGAAVAGPLGALAAPVALEVAESVLGKIPIVGSVYDGAKDLLGSILGGD